MANTEADIQVRLLATDFPGFLGQGNTTLLNHVLKNSEDWRVAFIVNDMSEVNLDFWATLRNPCPEFDVDSRASA